MTLLEARHLNVRYGAVEAIPDATLSVDTRQIATLIGPNGAGKSTLLNALMGALLEPGTCRGQLLLEGADISGLSAAERFRLGLVLVPETRELFGTMTVEDNLVLGGYVHRRNKRPGELDRVFALFPRLIERRKQQARTLSGGERQMLALGRALMGRPRLLMLDEPSLGLAPRTAANVFSVIAGLPEQGISVLLVEQNARAALRIADYAYVLETGQITLQGPAKTLQSDPKIISTYLGLAATIEPGAPSKSERSISADE